MKTLLAGIAFAIGLVFLLLKLSQFRARMVRGNTVTTSAPIMTNRAVWRIAFQPSIARRRMYRHPM